VSIASMDSGYRWWTWFVEQWPRAGLVCAVVVLSLLPVVVTEGNRPLVLLVTLLPIYMIHQYEEHGHGRFLAFFNATVGNGHEILTTRAAFWANIGGVWAVYVISFYLARYVALGFAFVPIYLMLVNGVTHMLATLRLREYNPGLWTSLVLFLPWGGYLLVYFNEMPGAGMLVNLAAFVFAVGIHVAIVVYALRRRARMEAEGEPVRSELSPGS
jgi:hypothetical protein